MARGLPPLGHSCGARSVAVGVAALGWVPGVNYVGGRAYLIVAEATRAQSRGGPQPGRCCSRDRHPRLPLCHPVACHPAAKGAGHLRQLVTASRGETDFLAMSEHLVGGGGKKRAGAAIWACRA